MNPSTVLSELALAARLVIVCAALGAAPAVAQGAFVIDSSADNLYAVDHYTGAVALIGSTDNNGLATPVDLTWRRVTQELWTIDRSGGEIGTLDVETAEFTPVHATGLDGWDAIAWHEVNRCFYMTRSDDNLYRYTPWNAQLTMIGPTGYTRIGTLDVDADNKLYGVAFAGSIVSLNTGTGAGTTVSSTTNFVTGLAIEPYSGRWYAIDASYETLERIDPATGGTTLMGSLSLTGFITLPRGLAFAERRDSGVVLNRNTGDIFLCDLSTGARHFVTNFSAPLGVVGIAYDSNQGEILVAYNDSPPVPLPGFPEYSKIERFDLSQKTWTLHGEAWKKSKAIAFDQNTGQLFWLFIDGNMNGLPTGLLDLRDLEVDAFGTLYGVRRNGEIHVIDKLTGVATFLGHSVYGAVGLTIEHGTGHFLVQDGVQLYCVDRNTFAVTPRGLFSGSANSAFAGYPHAPAYVIDEAADQIATLDLETGTATPIAATNNHGLSLPTGLTYRADTDELWVIDGSGGELGILEPATGQFTPCFEAGPSGMESVAWDPQTSAFYVAAGDGTIRKLDPAIGLPVTLGPSGFSDLRGLDVDKNGLLHGVDYATGSLVTINKTTGAATSYGATAAQIQALSIDQDGGDFYVARTTTDDLSLVDPVGGALTPVGPFGAGLGSVRGLAVIGSSASTLARVLIIGTSCGGMSAASQEPPRFSADWELYLNAPQGTQFGGVAIGLQNPNLSLNIVGAPGCMLYTDMVDIVWLQMPFGSPSHTISVPPVGSLAGFELYAQAFGYAPQVNDLGVVTSNGIYGRVGW